MGKEETYILPSHTYPLLDLRALWQYRDLLWLLVRKEYVTQFRQTWLGPLWILLQPVAMSLVLYVVFHRAVKLASEGASSFLFYFSGIIVWMFFSQVVEAVSFCLIQNARMFDKVYFPRLILPFSLLTWRLFSFAIHLGLLALWQLPGVKILWLPWVVLCLSMLAMGTGLFVAAVSVRYRDLQQVIRLCLQLLFFATPIVYDSRRLTPEWNFVNWLNPLAAPLQLFRSAFINVDLPSAFSIIFSTVISAFALGVGLWAFRWIERRFVDTI